MIPIKKKTKPQPPVGLDVREGVKRDPAILNEKWSRHDPPAVVEEDDDMRGERAPRKKRPGEVQLNLRVGDDLAELLDTVLEEDRRFATRAALSRFILYQGAKRLLNGEDL